MHSIIENYNNEETIIGNVKNIDSFVKFVKDGLKSEEYIFKTNITNESILTDLTLVPGKYLIHTEKLMTYLEKKDEINQGYVYNTHMNKIHVLYTWKLIPNNTYKSNNNITKKNAEIDDSQSFGVGDIKNDSKIIIVGKRGCGKSLLIKSILQNFEDEFIEHSLVINPHEGVSPFYGNYFNTKIECSLNEETINEYIESEYKCAIIIADYIVMQLSLTNKLLNSNKLVIITYQIPYPNIKECNFTFLFNDDTHYNQKKMYNFLCNESTKFPEFLEQYKKITSQCGCMVVCNDEKNDKFKYYKSS
jgi:hypothetical protein